MPSRGSESTGSDFDCLTPNVLRLGTVPGHDELSSIAREVRPIFSAYLEPFADCEPLRHRVQKVLSALPEAVQRDFLEDPRFRVTLENFVPGKGSTLWMACPGPHGSGSRCVVLRRRLAYASEDFACYVVAHEFAHAYLRNGGWGEITDVEEAADALAASWGFHRPVD